MRQFGGNRDPHYRRIVPRIAFLRRVNLDYAPSVRPTPQTPLW
jgi:hypothetical protein